MHLKRQKMPKQWPVVRKGTKFITGASHAKTKAIPLVVVLRDILKIVQTKKEARFMLLNGDVKINNKVRKNEKFPVQVFDVVSFDKTKKNYKMEIVNKKFQLKEIPNSESWEKIVKIIGKKILGKDKVQINLEDGQNFLIKQKFAVNDSVVVDTRENKIKKILELKEDSKVEIISGKHAGDRGVVRGVEKLTRGKRYLIKLKTREVNLPLKTILVIG